MWLALLPKSAQGRDVGGLKPAKVGVLAPWKLARAQVSSPSCQERMEGVAEALALS